MDSYLSTCAPNTNLKTFHVPPIKYTNCFRGYKNILSRKSSVSLARKRTLRRHGLSQLCSLLHPQHLEQHLVDRRGSKYLSGNEWTNEHENKDNTFWTIREYATFYCGTILRRTEVKRRERLGQAKIAWEGRRTLNHLRRKNLDGWGRGE